MGDATVFEISVATTVEVAVDDSLMPDDEWRATFYNLKSLEQMAGHIVWNIVVQRFSQVEGIAPEDHNKFRILDVESEIVEERQLGWKATLPPPYEAGRE